MDREDIVLIIYINVGQKEIPEATAYMERVKRDIENKTEKFTVFFVPIRSGDSRIECINPILLDKKEYATKVSKILVDYEIKLIDFLAKPEPKRKTPPKVIEPPKMTIPKTPKKVEPEPTPAPVKPAKAVLKAMAKAAEPQPVGETKSIKKTRSK